MDAGIAGERRWRIGTVPYRVAQPLTLGLAEDARVELTIAPPAQLAAMLRAGELDVALASSVLSLGENALPIWEAGPVIASEGPVRSVLLLVRPGVAPSELRSWIADPHSRTGRALAAIALAECFETNAERYETDGDDLFAAAERHGADAVQVIGDPALRALLTHPDWTVVDLGECWHTLTGLPFVFAGWVGAPGCDPTAAAALLNAAANQGIANREALAVEAAAAATPEAALGEDFFRRYLLQDMTYRLPEGQVAAALREFGTRLAKTAM